MLARQLTARSSEGLPVRSPPIDAARLPASILLVCTANQCRSPMAEGLLRHRLAAAGIDAVVRSAGLMPGGVVATPHAVEVLASRGIDLGDHRSRTIDADEVLAADLVLGMERRHVQEAVILAAPAEAWSFTLRDLVARAEAAAPRGSAESMRDWASRLSAGRPRSALLGVGNDAVDDPIGGPRSQYVRTADEIDDLLARVIAAAFPGEVAA